MTSPVEDPAGVTFTSPQMAAKYMKYWLKQLQQKAPVFQHPALSLQDDVEQESKNLREMQLAAAKKEEDFNRANGAADGEADIEESTLKKAVEESSCPESPLADSFGTLKVPYNAKLQDTVGAEFGSASPTSDRNTPLEFRSMHLVHLSIFCDLLFDCTYLF